jgi:hypothetical protein
VIEKCRAVCFDGRVGRHLPILLLVGAAFALLPAAAGAETRGPVGATWVECTPTLIEGQTYAEECVISVEDRPDIRNPGTVPSPPLGTVTIDGVSTCTLVPIGELKSACNWATTVTWGSSFRVEIYYPGDETHWQIDSSFEVLAPGNILLLPEIPARAPTAAEAAEHHVTGIEIPEPQIVSQPPKRTYAHLATFRFAGGEQYECALDKGGFRPSGGSFSRHVSTGPHVLRVRRQSGARPAVYRWRVLPRRG